MRSFDNNKTTVCHLEKSAAYSGTGQLEGDSDFHHSVKIPRRKELVARVRKILQEKIKSSRNCPFERLEWSVFLLSGQRRIFVYSRI